MRIVAWRLRILQLAAAAGPLPVPDVREALRARRAGHDPRPARCNPCFHATGAHCINADTSEFMQLIEGDPFADFPELRLIIPHGGGAVPYHWGRYRGLADMLEKPELSGHVMKNVFFDTCVYHQPGKAQGR